MAEFQIVQQKLLSLALFIYFFISTYYAVICEKIRMKENTNKVAFMAAALANTDSYKLLSPQKR
jgi:hypothetical protein